MIGYFSRIKSLLRLDFINESQNDYADSIKQINRQLRRIAMHQEQQKDQLNNLGGKVAIISNSYDKLASVKENKHQIYLSILGNIHRLSQLQECQQSTTFSTLLAELSRDLEALTRWQPIATIGESYDPQNTEIVDAIEHSEVTEPGIVVEIINQGYVTHSGELINRAKVIVSKEKNQIPQE